MSVSYPPPPARPRLGEPRGAPNSRTQAVLFDLDDTLFDHSRTLALALRDLRRDEPVLRARPIGEVVREYERLMDVVQASKLGGRFQNHEAARTERFRRLIAWSGGPDDRATAEDWSRRYRSYYQSHRTVVDGAGPLLRRLRRSAVVGIVTNNHTREQEEKLDVLGLQNAVDFLLTSEAAGVGKPDPAIFRRALDLAGVPADRTVMVGDSWASDIEGALAVGIHPVWLDRRSAPAGPRPDVPILRALGPADEVARYLLRLAEPAPSPRRRKGTVPLG